MGELVCFFGATDDDDDDKRAVALVPKIRVALVLGVANPSYSHKTEDGIARERRRARMVECSMATEVGFRSKMAREKTLMVAR